MLVVFQPGGGHVNAHLVGQNHGGGTEFFVGVDHASAVPGQRIGKGDAAPLAIIEFVDHQEGAPKGGKAKGDKAKAVAAVKAAIKPAELAKAIAGEAKTETAPAQDEAAPVEEKN